MEGLVATYVDPQMSRRLKMSGAICEMAIHDRRTLNIGIDFLFRDQNGELHPSREYITVDDCIHVASLARRWINKLGLICEVSFDIERQLFCVRRPRLRHPTRS